MHWLYLTLAIFLEVAGTTSMKLSEGFSKWLPTLFVFVFYGLSFTFVAQALKILPVSITYAIWSAVGTAAIAIIGIVWFGEQMSALKLGSLLLIIIGVMGLHFSQEPLH
uniref:SMR drug efflux transporter n=1 Tax=Chlorobium chlorochromatii (strain CaD3) TaxID=340177 RepID=Q3ARL8_CHLCH